VEIILGGAGWHLIGGLYPGDVRAGDVLFCTSFGPERRPELLEVHKIKFEFAGPHQSKVYMLTQALVGREPIGLLLPSNEPLASRGYAILRKVG
jgi:hypothetical protein